MTTSQPFPETFYHMWQRKTAIFLTSQTCSQFGSMLVQYALFWYVTLDTKSGYAMTLYIICGFVPTFLLSPFGGVWVDRYDRKKMIMLADGFIALVTLILAILFMVGGKSLALVLLTASLRAVGTAIQGPAVGAILPQFVPSEHLTKVNGISGTLQASITIISPLVSGVLFSTWPLHMVFFIDVITAVIAIVTLLFFFNVPTYSIDNIKNDTGYFNDLKLGFVYIKRHRYLISFFTFIGVFLFLITPAAMLSPLQVTRSFGSDVWRLSAIEIAFSGGMIVGGALISIWGGFRNRMCTILIATFIMAVCNIGLGIVPMFWLYLATMVIYGIAMPFYNTPATVIIQEHVEPVFLGRIFSIHTMLFSSIMPLGMLFFGPLAESVRIELLLIVTGILMLTQITWALGQKKLIEAGIVDPSSETGAPENVSSS